MILKDYQQQAIQNLEDFLKLLDENKTISQSFKDFWASRDVQARPPYQNNIPGVPPVCFKVPTGGGKTFMAAASIKSIFDSLPTTQIKMIVWLVPSETILSQTYKNLSNTSHPYRQKLDIDFNGQVEVYNKAQLLAGESFSPIELSDKLSILVLSYDSFRTSNKEGRKAYQQNGQLNKFVSQFADDEELLPNADEISLIQVIRHYKPVIIVDESHHATTNLSLEMLKNFNPSFILELTATPKENSNIICYVPAAKLKAAGMVKLPVIIYNRYSQEDVISDAIDFRNRLEQIAKTEKIRPIVLFQAELQGTGERTTFDKIKEILIQNFKISPEQIAIKTADINDLKNVDLLAENCPIRYIITINALKEGWDCPFAYILASLANRSSAIDVEQILGRILRRPFTKNFTNKLLNMSYVFTSSDNFCETLDKIVLGLNAAGFSDKEYRSDDYAELFPTEHSTENIPEQQNIFSSQRDLTSKSIEQKNNIAEMERQALFNNDIYESETANNQENIRSNEEIDRMTSFHMCEQFQDAKNILLPQFFYKEDFGNAFGGVQDKFVNKEMFSSNFSLEDKDTQINFDNLNYEIVSLDIQDKEDFPRYKYFSDVEVKAFLEYFDNLTLAGQVRQCAAKISAAIDKHNNPASQKIFNYVIRIVTTFDRERLRDAAQYTSIYAKRIKDKINHLLAEFAMSNFSEQIDSRKIFAKPSYKFPDKISTTRFQKSWANSLYVAEEDVNNLEYKVASALTSLDNVLWWHRNCVNKEEGFVINGFINHYPDFIVNMKSGLILLIEAKGDDRDNSDSKRKLQLGKIWESKADSNKFAYFMIFDNNPLQGALSFDEFVSRIKKL